MTKDKSYHILAGLLIAMAVGLPAYLESLNLFAGLWSALTSGIIAGGVKEWCDTQYGYGWDWRDLGRTVAGAAVGALLIVLMHIAKG